MTATVSAYSAPTFDNLALDGQCQSLSVSESSAGTSRNRPKAWPVHQVSQTSAPDVTFVGDLEQAVTQAKAAAGDKYVNILGADTARQCLAAGLLDEILTCIAPVLLGDGVRLFDHPGGTDVKLERISLTQAEKATNLLMRVVR